MLRAALILTLTYLGMGVSTNLFLFHFPVLRRSLNADEERLRIARTIPPLERVRERVGSDAAIRAVSVGIVVLWPLFVMPLLRWMSSIGRR